MRKWATISIASCMLMAGCAAPWYRQAPSALPSAAPAPAASESAPDRTSKAGSESDERIRTAVAELEKIGDLDAKMREDLIADLRATPPALWEPTLQVYRSALAYRKQTAERDAAELKPPAPVEELKPAPSAPTIAAPVAAPAASALAFAMQAAAQPAPSAADAASIETASPAEKPSAAPVEPAPPTAANTVALVSAELPAVEKPRDAVAPAVHEQPAAPALSWEQHLEQAIAGLESAAGTKSQNAEELHRQVNLRMLNLAAGRREQALTPIAGLSPAQQDFWSKQFYGLSTYLDHHQFANPSDRAAASLRYLNAAAAQLAEQSPLRVKNLAFCSEVKSFGVYTKFEKYEFNPEQELLLYAEVENFKSEETENGYVTLLKSSYQILDSRGQRVEAKEFPVTEEVCKSRRRDFFMRYFIWVPKRIYDGGYTLQLTIEDVKNQKFDQASIEFQVKGAG